MDVMGTAVGEAKETQGTSGDRISHLLNNYGECTVLAGIEHSFGAAGFGAGIRC